ncbi:aldehyde dehydrogenase family protein [Bacillus subtilis]|nr:aldehyde dehydrogenase family protein [Bacillus subtilis]
MSVSTEVAEREWDVMLNGAAWPTQFRYEIENPTTGKRLATVPDLNEEEVGQVVAAAQAIQPQWAALPPRSRAATMRRLADIIRQNRDELATLDALDGGCPYVLSQGAAASFFKSI